ncbi:MAG: GNAT family N-acetyltransferase [Ignavibacteriaceae bacterium]
MYKTKIYNSITGVKKESWDALTGNNVYMCYEFLKTFEETLSFPLLPHYITINEHEEIIGASVCYFEQKNEGRIIDKVILGKLLKFGLIEKLSFFPAVICNRQRGNGTHFILYPGISNDQIILLQNKILDEIERIAKNNKASVCFMNINENETQLMKSLKKRGYYKSMDLPSNFIDIKWSSFEEYENHLSKKYLNMKKSIRRELNKNRKSGVIIEKLENINSHHERLLELLKKNHFKYNLSPFPFKPDLFKKIKENFGNNTSIYIAVKDGIIIGVQVELRRGKEVFLSNVGIDYEYSQKDFTFFNLAYYEPIKHAIQYDIARIYYGRGSYETKMRRGCTTQDMYIFYKPRKKLLSPIVNLWFAFHYIWMKRKISYIKEL